MTVEEKQNLVLIKLYDLLKTGQLRGKLCALSTLIEVDSQESRKLGIYLKESGYISGSATSSGFAATLTTRGELYVEKHLLKPKSRDKTSYSKSSLTMREKYHVILKSLYFLDNGYYEVSDLLAEYQDTPHNESFDIGKGLERKGYVKFIGSKGGASIELNAYGREYVEEELLKETVYEPSDYFTEIEKNDIATKLNELLDRITTLENGQQIIYDDFEKEFENLKVLLNVLGKKDWKQLLFGKLVDAGLGAIAGNVLSAVVSIFKDQDLIT